MSVISSNHKFCFVHIPRTGGTTIKYLLGKQVTDLIETKIKNATIDNLIYDNHDCYEYYKFSFVRNPYDWLVSLYSDATNNSNHLDYPLLKNFSMYDFLIWLQDVGLKREQSSISPFYRKQNEYIKFGGGIFMDNVYKYEDLCDDIGSSNVYSLFNNLGLNFPVKVPLLNKSDRNFIWANYFDYKSYRLVNEIFKEDFKFFRYKTLAF